MFDPNASGRFHAVRYDPNRKAKIVFGIVFIITLMLVLALLIS